MEVSPGYKQTEIGVIPEDWSVKSLGTLGDVLIGLTYAPSDVRRYGTIVLRSSNIQNDALAFEDNVFVDMEIPERIMVRTGDVLICVRNGSRPLIGKTALLDEADQRDDIRGLYGGVSQRSWAVHQLHVQIKHVKAAD